MGFFWDSFVSAIHLLLAADSELIHIVGVSLTVSSSSTLLASFAGIPLGLFLGFVNFLGKRVVITLFQTLLALPTVVVGLFVYAFISRRGIFGPLDLLYTKTAIVIGQTILIIPVVTVLTLAAISRMDKRYKDTALTLGAGPLTTARAVAWEARFGIMAAIAAAFGRVIAEVGISMMLGGNAKGFTRTMPTAMALEYDKGEFVLSIALGLILLALALGVNGFLQFFQGKARQ